MIRLPNRHHPWLAALMLLLGLVPVVAPADSEPTIWRLSQTWQQGAEVTAYLDVRDESGAPVTALDAGQLHAAIGAQVAEVVEIEPFTATGEGVLYLFLVDRSRSLSAARFGQIRAALTAWVDAMEAGDMAALITFGERVETLVAPTADPRA